METKTKKNYFQRNNNGRMKRTEASAANETNDKKNA